MDGTFGAHSRRHCCCKLAVALHPNRDAAAGPGTTPLPSLSNCAIICEINNVFEKAVDETCLSGGFGSSLSHCSQES